MELPDLSFDGYQALLTALRALPDDRDAPTPMCARLNEVRDMLDGLARHPELGETDHTVFRKWRASLPLIICLAQTVDFLRMYHVMADN